VCLMFLRALLPDSNKWIGMDWIGQDRIALKDNFVYLGLQSCSVSLGISNLVTSNRTKSAYDNDNRRFNETRKMKHNGTANVHAYKRTAESVPA